MHVFRVIMFPLVENWVAHQPTSRVIGWIIRLYKAAFTQDAVLVQRGAALPRGAVAAWNFTQGTFWALFVSSSGTVANGLKGRFNTARALFSQLVD